MFPSLFSPFQKLALPPSMVFLSRIRVATCGIGGVTCATTIFRRWCWCCCLSRMTGFLSESHNFQDPVALCPDCPLVPVDRQRRISGSAITKETSGHQRLDRGCGWRPRYSFKPSLLILSKPRNRHSSVLQNSVQSGALHGPNIARRLENSFDRNLGGRVVQCEKGTLWSGVARVVDFQVQCYNHY